MYAKKESSPGDQNEGRKPYTFNRNTVSAGRKGNERTTAQNTAPTEEFPFPGYINRDQVGFHKRPEAGDNYIRPDFREGEEVRVLSKTQDNWYYVERTIKGKKVYGYVDHRYVTRLQIVELKEVVIERLSLATIKKCCSTASSLIKKANGKEKQVNEVLQLLRKYHKEYHPNDFSRIMICLHKSGSLKKLLGVVSDEQVEYYYEILAYVSVFENTDNVLDMVDRVAISEGIEQTINNIDSRDFLRYPTLSDPIPVESVDKIKKNVKKRGKDVMKQHMQKILKNKEIIMNEVDRISRNAMKLRAIELELYWEAKDYSEVKRIILEMNSLMEGGLEFFFSSDPKSSVANRPTVQMLMKLIDIQKSDLELPNMFIGADPNEPVTKYFDPKSGQLIDPNKPNKTKSTNNKKKVAKVDPDAALKHEAKEFIKELIVRQADVAHDFFYKDLAELGTENPGLVAYINQIVRGTIKKDAYSKLSKGVTLSDNTDKPSTKSRKNMQWIDLARIWQYELGHASVGTSEGNPLAFGQDDWTTKSLRKHPSTKTLEAFAKARVKSGDMSDYNVQVKYDVAGFWNAIFANDVAFNFLGSFQVEIRPSQDGKTIEFTATNVSGRESGSRFRRDPNSQSFNNKVGILEDVERTPANQKPKDVPLGGNLYQRWEWKIKA